MSATILTLYAVRNAEGEWMRSSGYGGGGRHWVTDIRDAKLYGKLGQARARVTFWANAYPEKAPPVIVELTATETRVIAEEDRVEAAKLRKKTAVHEQKIRDAKRAMRAAERKIAEANETIRRLRDTAAGGAA